MNMEIKISLNEFDKEINRTIRVNDDMLLTDFCEAMIYTMNGQLEHLYLLNYNGETYACTYFGDLNVIPIEGKRIKNLHLQAKDRLVLEYDTGDGWEFNIQVKKITEGHQEKQYTVINGKGKGLIEDCGGTFGLSNFINGTVNDEIKEWYFENFGEDKMYDINDFDIESLNIFLDTRYNH